MPRGLSFLLCGLRLHLLRWRSRWSHKRRLVPCVETMRERDMLSALGFLLLVLVVHPLLIPTVCKRSTVRTGLGLKLSPLALALLLP